MYQLELTDGEVRALEMVRGRYMWPEKLVKHLDPDTRVVLLRENEMWEWDMDCEKDEEGGHSAFPMASPDFAEKLQEFRGRIV